jgi:AmpE protein
MAKILLAILFVLVGARALPDLARLRDFSWLRDALARSSSSDGRAAALPQLLLIPALLVFAVGLIQFGLHGRWFGLPELAFMMVVLYLSWGPRDLDGDIEAVLKAPDRERRTVAAQALNEGISDQPLPFTASAVVEAGFAAALSRNFGVLFWFVLAGPAGALAYRFVQLLARSAAFRDATGNARATLERIALILDWAPAHLLALSLALVSDFDATVRAWRDYHAAHGKGYFTLDLGFLAVIARAGVDADIAAGDGGIDSIGNPVAELADARVVLRRVLFVWLAVIAVIVLGGWAG